MDKHWCWKTKFEYTIGQYHYTNIHDNVKVTDPFSGVTSVRLAQKYVF